MKYIDAERLKAEIERHIKEVKDVAGRFTPNLGFFDAKLSGIYDVMAIIDSLQQEQPDEHHTKRNELFDQCVANCDPKVMQEVSDKVDKLKSISTPAEEDWFEIDKEWEKEDEKSATERNELEKAIEEQIDRALFKWSYDDEDGIEQYVDDSFRAGVKWAMEHKEDKR